MNTLLEAPLQAVLRRPQDGTPLRTFGGELNLFLTGAQSGGWLTAGIFTAPAGNGPPAHIHHREDELLIVLEGHFAFLIHGEWTEGGPGTTAFLPRGKAHSFRNIGDTPGKLYVMANPPGLETFFARCEEPFHRPDGPDFETIAGIGAEHGIEFV